MSEIVLIFHFMIVIFFIVGFFVGLVWNQSIFRYIHAGCLGAITFNLQVFLPDLAFRMAVLVSGMGATPF